MEIIKANETHIPEILEIYAKARKFMKENGNPTQWEEGYPSREIVEKDIAADHCYVCMENEKVVWGICLYHWRGSYISRNLSGGMAQ